MSRRLLVSLVLGPLLLGASASACPTCALPPAAELAADPPPQAVFEAAPPGALLPEERDWLLAAEDGRYELVNGRLSDRKAAVAEKHLLTNSAAWLLLGRRTTERVAVLRTLAKDGPLPPEAHGEAVGLFWLRGTLASPEDQAFLRDAAGPKAKPEPRVGGFENGAQKALVPSPSQAGGSAPGSAAQTSALLLALRGSLILPSSSPAADAAMNLALKNLVETPTGRELALEFVASGARAKVQFGEVENSAVVLSNGRRVLQASGGNSNFSGHPPVVTLNRDFLSTDPEYRRPKMAAVLGHELFGHVLEAHRSARAGIPGDVFDHYRGDEAGAGLIGWLVGAELGGRLDSGHMWNYLADPEKYHKSLTTNMPYYSTILSVAEMRDPVAALERRVKAITASRRENARDAGAMMAWRPRITHFIKDHGMPADQFSAILEDINASVVWNNAQQKTLDDIQQALSSAIYRWKSPAAAPTLAAMNRAAGSTYLRQSEERLTARADRLRRLVSGRSWEASVPPVPGKLTWDELTNLTEQDRKNHPEHWRQLK